MSCLPVRICLSASRTRLGPVAAALSRQLHCEKVLEENYRIVNEDRHAKSDLDGHRPLDIILELCLRAYY